MSEQGRPFAAGIESYTVSVFGRPSATTPWMLQYGGHHLALNALAQENDRAFALLNALDETQRKQAFLNYRVSDLVLGPGQAVKTIQPEGLKVATMNEPQSAMLLHLVSEWASIVNDAYAVSRMADIKAGLDET